MPLYNLDAARTDEQRKKMQDLTDRGVCIFCWEHIENEDKSEILHKSDTWIVKRNSYPYNNSRNHLLLIPRSHVTTLTELTTLEQSDFAKTIKYCEDLLTPESYAVIIRSGDMRRNGGSIEHLHVHLIEGDTENPDHQAIKVKISSVPKS